mmetsp:Transcript_22821/g.73445  ORF Transcript_22821/g.73445 Transcript_22821/m.73445 type:complete len:257 (+) Transcript_22821:54-824(+)
MTADTTSTYGRNHDVSTHAAMHPAVSAEKRANAPAPRARAAAALTGSSSSATSRDPGKAAPLSAKKPLRVDSLASKRSLTHLSSPSSEAGIAATSCLSSRIATSPGNCPLSRCMGVGRGPPLAICVNPIVASTTASSCPSSRISRAQCVNPRTRGLSTYWYTGSPFLRANAWLLASAGGYRAVPSGNINIHSGSRDWWKKDRNSRSPCSSFTQSRNTNGKRCSCIAHPGPGACRSSDLSMMRTMLWPPHRAASGQK